MTFVLIFVLGIVIGVIGTLALATPVKREVSQLDAVAKEALKKRLTAFVEKL